MKIERVDVRAVGPPIEHYTWSHDLPEQYMTNTIVRLYTDAGVEGVSGAVSLRSGVATAGNSGAISVSSGSATEGSLPPAPGGVDVAHLAFRLRPASAIPPPLRPLARDILAAGERQREEHAEARHHRRPDLDVRCQQ